MMSKWYDKGQLLSYHKLINFVIGNRGGGKTFGFKEWCISDAIKNSKQFVWIRRYKTELSDFNKFYDDIAFKFPDNKLTFKAGKKGGTFLADNKIIGYLIPLSISSSFKSVSYHNVDKIVFDEFLIDKSTYHYLKHEPIVFLDLIETIFRSRDNVRGAYLLGNNISFVNPYFLYFNIPQFNGRFYTKGEIAVEFYKNEKFIEDKYNTRFGKLIKGTEYGDYVIENEALLDNDKFMAKKTPNARFTCGLKYNGVMIGFWADYNEGKFYASKQYDPSSSYLYSLTRDDHDVNLFLIKQIKNTYFNDLLWAFRMSQLYFEDINVKTLVFEAFSYFTR